MRSKVWEQYQKFYVAMAFERAGLFKQIRQQYSCQEVLYPGCSYHITPSFYFPHVVYVDQSHAAATFFAAHQAVLDLIHLHKTYKRHPFVQFINQDYRQPLPLQPHSFDLVLAIYAGDIVRPCKVYLKPGGLLLTNNHEEDARYAAADPALELIAVIQSHAGSYPIITDSLPQFLTRLQHKEKPSAIMRQTSRGLLYFDEETYYLFRRIPSG